MSGGKEGKVGKARPLMMLDLVILTGPRQREEETKQSFIFRLQDPVVKEVVKLYNFTDITVKMEYLTWILDYMDFRFYLHGF